MCRLREPVTLLLSPGRSEICVHTGSSLAGSSWFGMAVSVTGVFRAKPLALAAPKVLATLADMPIKDEEWWGIEAERGGIT